jgi:hypothetical protein
MHIAIYLQRPLETAMMACFGAKIHPSAISNSRVQVNWTSKGGHSETCHKEHSLLDAGFFVEELDNSELRAWMGSSGAAFSTAYIAFR